MIWMMLLLQAGEGTVETVTGPVSAAELGRVLVHEHVLVDFIGAADSGPHRYNADEVFEVMLPHLLAVRAAGIDTVLECTPKHLGRDPRLLRRLSEAAGVKLVTNTGLYQGKFLPEWALTASVEALAADWIAEATDGLEGTGIKPGFIKIAVDGPPVSDVQQRIVRAAARCSLATGLPITMHCPPARSALQALDLLADEGCPAERLIVAHADAEPDVALHVEIARRGAWLSYDGIREARGAERARLTAAAWRQVPERLLISQDAGWYNVGDERGGNIAPLDWLPREFGGLLRAEGLDQDAIETLFVGNPARALPRRGSLGPL